MTPFTVNDRITIDDRLRILRGLPAPVAAHASWLTPVLLQTEAAIQRLQRWLDAGAPDPRPADQVAVYGDGNLTRAAIVEAVARIPAPPVRWHVERNVLIVTVGGTTRGWTGLLPQPSPTRDEAPRMVVINAGVRGLEELLSVVAHEIAHAWCEPLAHEAVAADALRGPDTRAVLALADQWNCHAEVRAVYQERERQVARLAWSWGFRGTAADVVSVAKRAGIPGEEDR